MYGLATQVPPVQVRSTDQGGLQALFRFPNGYGASIIGGGEGDYGNAPDTWELAVIRWHGEGLDDFDLVYDTGITDGVLGWLTPAEVDEHLIKIMNLETKPTKQIGA